LPLPAVPIAPPSGAFTLAVTLFVVIPQRSGGICACTAALQANRLALIRSAREQPDRALPTRLQLPFLPPKKVDLSQTGDSSSHFFIDLSYLSLYGHFHCQTTSGPALGDSCTTADTVDVCPKSTRLCLRNQPRWKTAVREAWTKD